MRSDSGDATKRDEEGRSAKVLSDKDEMDDGKKPTHDLIVANKVANRQRNLRQSVALMRMLWNDDQCKYTSRVE